MRFCPFLNNFYNMDMYDQDYTRDAYEDEDLFEADAEEETDEYFDDSMRQGPQQEINRIMGLVNTRLGYLYNELQRNRINRNTARYLFRTIVSFTVNNAAKYTGTPEQRTTAIFNDFRRQYPWVLFIMRSNGITQNRANQIVRTVISFTLANMQKTPAPPEDIEQRATRIVNLIRQQTDIFTRLEGFGVPANTANTFVRTVVLFVLRNSNISQPPANLEARTAELIRAFETANPAVMRELQNLGIPLGQIRVLLRAIILFTLRSIYARDVEE